MASRISGINIPDFDRTPYERLKESTTRQAVGRSAQATRRLSALSRRTGTADVPGVRADVAQRERSNLNEFIARNSARIDMTMAKDKRNYDQWVTELQLREKELKEARKSEDRAMLSSAIGNIVGGVLSIYATPIAGVIAKKGVDKIAGDK